LTDYDHLLKSIDHARRCSLALCIVLATILLVRVVWMEQRVEDACHTLWRTFAAYKTTDPWSANKIFGWPTNSLIPALASVRLETGSGIEFFFIEFSGETTFTLECWSRSYSDLGWLSTDIHCFVIPI